MSTALRIWILAQCISAMLFMLLALAYKAEMVLCIIPCFIFGLFSILSFYGYLDTLNVKNVQQKYIHYTLAGFPVLTLINVVLFYMFIGLSAIDLPFLEILLLTLVPITSSWCAAYICVDWIEFFVTNNTLKKHKQA